MIAKNMSAEEQDGGTASSQKQATGDSATPAATEDFSTTKVVARSTGPRHADAPGFHLFNVVVHAMTCSCTVWIFRAVFQGECTLWRWKPIFILLCMYIAFLY